MQMNDHTQRNPILLTLKRSIFWIILLIAEILFFLYDTSAASKNMLLSAIPLIITLAFTVIDLRDNYKKVTSGKNE